MLYGVTILLLLTLTRPSLTLKALADKGNERKILPMLNDYNSTY